MLFLAKEDFYEVYLESIITENDRDTLTMLYQPIIGLDAVGLYLTLYNEFKKSKRTDSFEQHDNLSLLMDMPVGKIQEARRKLEAIGLLQTYYKEEKGIGFYKYLIFAPKTPKEFFDDVLFKGLLIERIGEKRVQALMRKYKSKANDLEGYLDITDSFKKVFSPNLDSSSYLNEESLDSFDRKEVDISKGFDKATFLKILRNDYSILTKNVSANDIKEFSSISMLYGINEIALADLACQTYKDCKFDFAKLKELAIKEKDFSKIRTVNSGSTAFDTSSKSEKLIESMENTSPIDFVKAMNNNTQVSSSDAALINELFNDYALNTGVINCLLSYCNQSIGSLSRAYVTKIASTLKRNNISCARDAMNYLSSPRKKKYVKSITEEIREEKVENNSSENTKEKLSNLELIDLLSGLK